MGSSKFKSLWYQLKQSQSQFLHLLCVFHHYFSAKNPFQIIIFLVGLFQIYELLPANLRDLLGKGKAGSHGKRKGVSPISRFRLEQIEIRKIAHFFGTIPAVKLFLQLWILFMKPTNPINYLLQNLHRNPMIHHLEKTPFPASVSDFIHHLFDAAVEVDYRNTRLWLCGGGVGMWFDVAVKYRRDFGYSGVQQPLHAGFCILERFQLGSSRVEWLGFNGRHYDRTWVRNLRKENQLCFAVCCWSYRNGIFEN